MKTKNKNKYGYKIENIWNCDFQLYNSTRSV